MRRLKMEYMAFNKLYGISREEEHKDDDCEFEVTEQAMKMYCKYPCYKEWQPFLYGGSIKHYLRYQRVLKNGYRGYAGYKGAYLLTNKKSVLTADIITSIRSVWKKFADEDCKLTGFDIREKILLDDKFLNKCPKELQVYMRAFASVYYWCGNMMPIISNFHPGKFGADNWMYKLKILMETENKGTHREWHDWINNEMNNRKVFINGYYLCDCFDVINGEPKLKNIVCSRQYDSLKPIYLEALKANNYILAKELLLNHIKLIIQRSYRIVNDYKDEWNKDSFMNVKPIIKAVLEYAGMSEKNADMHSCERF